MTLLIAALLLAGQADTIDTELRRILSASVHIEAAEGRYLSIDTDSLPDSDRAAPFVNRHRRVFEYLLTNAIPPQHLFDGVDASASAAERTRRFVANVLADAGTLSALRSYYKSILQPTPSPTARRLLPALSQAQALTIASRFFYPARIADGRVEVYRCSGINGVVALGLDRNLLFEAFAFETILQADTASGLNRDFAAARTHVQRYAHHEEGAASGLARAQANMYDLMFRSDQLRAVLRRGYVAWRGTLPFTVPEWERE